MCMYSRRDVIAMEWDVNTYTQHSNRLPQWLVTLKGFWTPWWWLRLSGRNMLEWLNNNKLINPKLICAFCWSVFSSILVVVNKHNTARVASCWFIIYYRLVMHGNSNIKLVYSLYTTALPSIYSYYKYPVS